MSLSTSKCVGPLSSMDHCCDAPVKSETAGFYTCDWEMPGMVQHCVEQIRDANANQAACTSDVLPADQRQKNKAAPVLSSDGARVHLPGFWKISFLLLLLLTGTAARVVNSSSAVTETIFRRNAACSDKQVKYATMTFFLEGDCKMAVADWNLCGESDLPPAGSFASFAGFPFQNKNVWAQLTDAILPDLELSFTREQACASHNLFAREFAFFKGVTAGRCVQLGFLTGKEGIKVAPHGGRDIFEDELAALAKQRGQSNQGCKGFTTTSSEPSFTNSVSVSTPVDASSDIGTFPVGAVRSVQMSTKWEIPAGLTMQDVDIEATFGPEYTASQVTSCNHALYVPKGQIAGIAAFGETTVFHGHLSDCPDGSKPEASVAVLRKDSLFYNLVFTDAQKHVKA